MAVKRIALQQMRQIVESYFFYFHKIWIDNKILSNFAVYNQNNLKNSHTKNTYDPPQNKLSDAGFIS